MADYYTYTQWPFTTTVTSSTLTIVTYGNWPFYANGTTATNTYNTISDKWIWQSTGTTTGSIVTDWVWRDDRTEEQKAADAERVAAQQREWEAGAAERARVAAEREAERVRANAEREKTRRAAKVKARRLLMSVLTPEQQDEFRRLERFHVIGADGKKYRVHRGWHHNVELVEKENEVEYLVEQFCIAPRDTEVPEDDNLAAQKLMIEGDLASFRRISNITRIHRAAEAGGQDVVRREALG